MYKFLKNEEPNNLRSWKTYYVRRFYCLVGTLNSLVSRIDYLCFFVFKYGSLRIRPLPSTRVPFPTAGLWPPPSLLFHCIRPSCFSPPVAFFFYLCSFINFPSTSYKICFVVTLFIACPLWLIIIMYFFFLIVFVI